MSGGGRKCLGGMSLGEHMSERKWPGGYFRGENSIDPIIIHLELNYINFDMSTHGVPN